MTGSGKAAMATRLTVAAATAPPVRPSAWRKLLLELMNASKSRVDGLANQSHLQVALSQPEISQSIDVAIDRRDLLAGIGQQVEHADEHAVVAKLVLFGDALAQRHYLVAVMAGNVMSAAVAQVGLAPF